MNYDFYSYITQMQQYMEMQQQRIIKLEHELQRLSEEMENMKKRPPVHVDRIEYKFDQLKVESLDGTLNIGLNPSDLDNIDEFAVNQQNGSQATPGPFLFPERERMIQEIADGIMSELDQMIHETEKQVRITIDPAYKDMIKGDVGRQLVQKIISYIDQTPPNERHLTQLDRIGEKVTERVKTDIQTALTQFISHTNS
ncbi:spore germination protein GerPC [Bacillus massiliglaciei]|uniref:spore germination protein GerPC n=1 Tax=Bacillus massiliglaciei TaxID=1816693 RepID=UPI000B246089|nr:spore germination protein GerPC [Bacillus massiliglaciei]